MTKLWLIGGGAFLGILLIGSLILAFTQEEELLPLGTAEAAVQDFLRAAEAEDFDVSYGYLSEELKAECAIEDFVGRNRYEPQRSEDARITLDKVTVVGEITFVDVNVSRYYGRGPIGTSESTYREQFSLKQEGGLWKFSSYPWPYNYCNPPRPPAAPPIVAHTPVPTPAPTPVPLLAPTAEPRTKPAAP